jgi:NAD(P)-dependent dehydrogenase (short-subunit alcohol dehydrogenase family)
MNGRLQDKVALVTGGGSGIGRATALVFAREGAKVVVADVDVNSGEKTVQIIGEAGGDATCIKADVSQRSEVETLVLRLIERYGRLDCACNNVGIQGVVTLTADCTEDNWDSVMDTNLRGTWLCMKYEIAQMLKQSAGAIVNIASGAGLLGVQGLSAYCASKHGVVGLTKAAALDYATAGIRINAVCPGAMRTRQLERYLAVYPEDKLTASIPMGRLGRPEEIAEAVVWLCTDAASYMTGHSMVVDGGYVVP